MGLSILCMNVPCFSIIIQFHQNVSLELRMVTEEASQICFSFDRYSYVLPIASHHMPNSIIKIAKYRKMLKKVLQNYALLSYGLLGSTTNPQHLGQQQKHGKLQSWRLSVGNLVNICRLVISERCCKMCKSLLNCFRTR